MLLLEEDHCIETCGLVMGKGLFAKTKQACLKMLRGHGLRGDPILLLRKIGSSLLEEPRKRWDFVIIPLSKTMEFLSPPWSNRNRKAKSAFFLFLIFPSFPLLFLFFPPPYFPASSSPLFFLLIFFLYVSDQREFA